MRIGFVELLLILLIASLTIGPSAALWVDRWLRRANRASAAAARRRAVQEAQRAAEREEVLQRFQKLSIVFTLAAVAALVWALVLRPIEAPPKTYTAPDHRQASGAAQAELSTDRREIWDLGGYQGVDCIRTRDGLVYAAAWNGSSLKKRTSDLVRTDGGNAAVILSVEGELTGFAFDAAGDLWLTVLTPAGGTLCRARHDSWGASVEQVVTQIDGAPLGALSAVEVGADGKVYFAVVGQESAERGWKAPCAPSCWPTPEQVQYTFMIPLPAPWSRWWAALPERPALCWTSAPRPSTFPTSAAAASGARRPLPAA